MFLILAVSMIMFLAPAADAADGVLEINQACVGVGCFSGDREGFPVEITVPGSYRLTSDLVLLDADVTGIEVAAPSVSIDLGGFEITTVACLEPRITSARVGLQSEMLEAFRRGQRVLS